jgi:two-component system chemotaxis response regulator CheB
LLGCEAIHQQGGQITVQDEATSVVWGMPRAVADAGLADRILPLDQISEDWITQTSRKPRFFTMTETGT